jgi:biotin-(acetyl-CoA carboxylase) ligase
MPAETRTRSRTLLTPEVTLPPPFTLVTLREGGDAFSHAISVAAERGAGTLIYVGRFDLAEFAVVLEPEEPLSSARRALYAGMVALADTLISHAQPETAINITWPDSLSVNGGRVGGGRLAWPRGAREDEVPPWLAFGATIRAASTSSAEPGETPLSTTLQEEGFVGLQASELVESFARHFMVALDAWQHHGFEAVAREYLRWLPPEKGLRRDIADNGDLLVSHMGKTAIERKELLPLLLAPGWLDPQTQEPRL